MIEKRERFVPKKRLGQNFMIDAECIGGIIDAIATAHTNEAALVEVGPGLGALTEKLFPIYEKKLTLVELDPELHDRLTRKYASIKERILHADFLKVDLAEISVAQMMVVGNFPYNISSPIFFKILKNRNLVKSVVCTIQHEVAQRLCAKPGSKAYGIPSVLVQTFYDVEYLFSIPPTAFDPVPKVRSAVVRLTRNDVQALACDESNFFTVVKQAFHQRRKTIRNSLKGLIDLEKNSAFVDLRAEQLSISDYISLTKTIGE